MNELSAPLDEVWRSHEPRVELCERIVRRLAPRTILQLVAIDVSVLLRLVPIAILMRELPPSVVLRGDGPEVSLHIAKSDEEPQIRYIEGIHIAALGSGQHVWPHQERSLARTLAACQVARDHIDSVTFLPSNMREERLQGYAADFNMSLDDFTQLAASYPALQRALS